MAAIHPLVRLAQRFTVDWLGSADPTVLPDIMAPDYLVHIGPVQLAGLPQYTEATLQQVHRFPGLLLTIQEVVTDGDRLALVFTEHGASAEQDLRPSAWRGVGLWRWDGTRLTENWSQEDYYGRRRQLTAGVADVIPAPAPAPWTTAPVPADPAAEDVARAWLANPARGGVWWDDGLADGPAIEVTGVVVDELFSAGDRVAFAASWQGTYRSGIDGAPNGAVSNSVLGATGVLTVRGGAVVDGRVVTDRHGLRRALRAGGGSTA